MDLLKRINEVLDASVGTSFTLDGYEVSIEPLSEKPGYFKLLVNGTWYGKPFASVQKARDYAPKLVAIRKEADRKSAARNPGDIQSKIASDFFSHAKRSGNPNS